MKIISTIDSGGVVLHQVSPGEHNLDVVNYEVANWLKYNALN